jgi:methionine salvage enolase-phosphatase E1
LIVLFFKITVVTWRNVTFVALSFLFWSVFNCNSVNFLIDIVYPKSDKELKDYIDKHEKESDEDDINKKIKNKRMIFKEINKMFVFFLMKTYTAANYNKNKLQILCVNFYKF